MTCPFIMDVDWHCVVKCGILAVAEIYTEIIGDR